MFLIKTLCVEGLNPPSTDNASYMAILPFYIFSEPSVSWSLNPDNYIKVHENPQIVCPGLCILLHTNDFIISRHSAN